MCILVSGSILHFLIFRVDQEDFGNSLLQSNLSGCFFLDCVTRLKSGPQAKIPFLREIFYFVYSVSF